MLKFMKMSKLFSENNRKYAINFIIAMQHFHRNTHEILHLFYEVQSICAEAKISSVKVFSVNGGESLYVIKSILKKI